MRFYLSKIKVAILGCGRMGLRHAEAYSKHPKVEIDGFYDAREDSGIIFSKEIPCKKI